MNMVLEHQACVPQVGRSRRCASMEARPSLWHAGLSGDCFGLRPRNDRPLAMTDLFATR